jgi:CRP/FNR family transcriptional regulator, cyclic AMP receptor protein
MPNNSALLEEIGSMLIESDLFSHLPATELSAAAHYFGINNIAQDETLYEEGDIGNFMCIVHSGNMAVIKANQNGQQVKMVTLGQGRTFGEMAVLDVETRSATCKAIEDTVLLTLSKEALDQMQVEHPRIGSNIIRAIAVSLSRRLHKAAGQLACHLV